MQGRLIFPVAARLHRVDPGATAVSPGYDPDFAEPRLVDANRDGVADVGRAELPVVELLCQVESDRQEQLRMTPAGDVPRSRLSLVFHTRHLIARGLLDRDTGAVALRPGDRLGGLWSLAGTPIYVPGAGRSLYLTEARLAGWGLGRVPRASLVIATFEDRPSARRGA